MCCRRNYNNSSTIYTTNTSHCQPRPRRQKGCCSSKRNYNYHTQTPAYPANLHPQTLQVQGRRVRGPCSGMAALILGGIGLAASKIAEKKEKKKAAKAAHGQLVWEDGQASGSVNRHGGLIHNGDGAVYVDAERRTSKEAKKDKKGRRTSRSSSVDRDEEKAPPSYDEVVGQEVRDRRA